MFWVNVYFKCGFKEYTAFIYLKIALKFIRCTIYVGYLKGFA
jgi:hypothetical protein